MKKRTAAVVFAIVLFVGALFGCITALETGSGIRLSEIRRIDVKSGFVGVGTAQHYYSISLSDDSTYFIRIQQLD
jgi:hypothetical protein